MRWLLMERSNGGKLVSDHETRQDAEKAKAELIVEDYRSEDVLYIAIPHGS